jgi:small subunit ribosomal protein S17
MERNKRRVLTGEVVSSSSDKTISVVVTSYRKHALYGKRVIQTKKYAVHDEANEANIGDTVRIMETRPLSKTKRFRLVEIVSTKA